MSSPSWPVCRKKKTRSTGIFRPSHWASVDPQVVDATDVLPDAAVPTAARPARPEQQVARPAHAHQPVVLQVGHVAVPLADVDGAELAELLGLGRLLRLRGGDPAQRAEAGHDGSSGGDRDLPRARLGQQRQRPQRLAALGRRRGPARRASYDVPHAQVSTTPSSVPARRRLQAHRAAVEVGHQGAGRGWRRRTSRVASVHVSMVPGGTSRSRRVHASLDACGSNRPICSSAGSSLTIPSASTATTSGAATRMASSMALFTVMADDGQPSQLPSSRRCTTPSASTPESGHATRVRAEVRADLVERPLHAGVDVVGVQVVEHQQVADQLVVGQAAYGVRADRLEHPLEPGAVQADHALEQLLDARHHGRRRTLRRGRRAATSMRSLTSRTDGCSTAELLSSIPSPDSQVQPGRRTGRRCAPTAAAPRRPA